MGFSFYCSDTYLGKNESGESWRLRNHLYYEDSPVAYYAMPGYWKVTPQSERLEDLVEWIESGAEVPDREILLSAAVEEM